MEKAFFVLLVLLAVDVIRGQQNGTTLSSRTSGTGTVKIVIPQRPGEARREETEAPIIKEDSSEVEEFPLIDKQVFGVGVGRRGQQPFPNDPFQPDVFGYNPAFPGTGAGDLEAFTVRRAEDHEIIPGTKVKFLDVVTQIGRGWKEGLNEFVCDTPGIFFFTFTSMGERYRHFRVTLKHNGIGVVSAYGDVNGYQMATNSAVLRLLARDRVYLELQEGGIYEVTTITGRAYNTFSGFRIL